MNNTRNSKLTNPRAPRSICAPWIVLLLVLALPPAVQAQFTYSIINGTITITGGCPYGRGPVTIPDTIFGLPVTSIGGGAFEFCDLSSVTIGNNVTNIGDSAFWFCTFLGSVTMGTNLTSIGYEAFAYCSSLTEITIPNSVTSIGDYAFNSCSGTTNLTIGNNVTDIGGYAFAGCSSVTDLTIGSNVTNIGDAAFGGCTKLIAITVDTNNPSYSSVAGVLFNKNQTALMQCPCGRAGGYTIPNGVTTIGIWGFAYCLLTNVAFPSSVNSIADYAFLDCTNLRALYFGGNAPSLGGAYVFQGDNHATVYYLPGTTGWGTTFGGRPTALWTQVPTIQTPPQRQTAEAGSAVGLWVDASSPLPLFYFWHFNTTNLLSSGTNWQLELPNVRLDQSGAYNVVISNVLGTVTSGPVMLQVIAPVVRRPVPGVELTGEARGLLNMDYADSVNPAANWTTVGSVTLTSTSQYYFDLTQPLPPRRFYRAWQAGTPGVMPSLDLHLVPAITLTGGIGGSVRVDAINQFGPIDAWFTLDTVALTNTSQLYFDTSAWGQPPRLYRLVQVP